MSAAVSPIVHKFRAPDGVTLACYELPAQGPPGAPARTAVLLHGILFNAPLNWIAPGSAALLAQAGVRVLALDFRGHGASDAPDDPAHYPKDILAMDVEALVAAFGLKDYTLAGYSLGARIAARVMARGARPRRLVLAGMGLGGLVRVADRQAHFEDLILHGERARNPQAGAFVQKFMQANGVKQGPALLVLASQCDTPHAALAAIACPTLVLCGERDADNGSAEELAAAIPGARLVRPPGEHLSSVGKPAFREALRAFLTED